MPDDKVTFVEVSHYIEDGMVTYKGLPEPRVTEFASRKALAIFYAEGTDFQIERIDMIGNTGTFLSSPFHRFPKGDDISQLPLSKLANLDCLIIASPAGKPSHAVPLSALEGLEVAGKAILINTGWSEHWGTDDYYQSPPYLSQQAGEFLAKENAALVGIDSPNIDNAVTNERPVYTALLGAGIPIIEHLTDLGFAPKKGGKFFAIPPRIEKVSCFPVRAFVMTAS